jgi:hypothetical protein
VYENDQLHGRLRLLQETGTADDKSVQKIKKNLLAPGGQLQVQFQKKEICCTQVAKTSKKRISHK